MRISRRKKAGKTYEYYQLVESYRVGTTVLKKVICSLSRDYATVFTKHVIKDRPAKLYALPTAIYSIVVSELGLSNIFSTLFKESKVNSNILLFTVLMIIHRIMDPDSKLSLTRWYKNILLPVPLPNDLDVHNLYYTLDYLMDYKEEIEKALYDKLKEKQLLEATIVFYDLTSSYFEGEDVEMAKYGYSRDHRPDLLQITLGLVIDKKNGLPIYHEVFEGNMSDGKTVKGILEKLKETFQIDNVIFVADKGMLTPDNLKELEDKKYQSILSESIRSALPQKAREELFTQKDAFTKLKGLEDTLWYKETKDKEGKAIVVCYNQYTAIKARITRDTKIKKLETLIKEIKEKHKDKTEKKDIQKVRETILAKLVTSHARKYFNSTETENVSDLFPLKKDVVASEEHMDGMWVVRGNADLTTEKLIETYKELKTIEASFRTIKDVIELRPIYHYKDGRVKGHVFICILSFLVIRLLEQKSGQTIKMLREKYSSAVAIPTNDNNPEKQPIILGGQQLLQAIC